MRFTYRPLSYNSSFLPKFQPQTESELTLVKSILFLLSYVVPLMKVKPVLFIHSSFETFHCFTPSIIPYISSFVFSSSYWLHRFHLPLGHFSSIHCLVRISTSSSSLLSPVFNIFITFSWFVVFHVIRYWDNKLYLWVSFGSQNKQ
jgi:hypothetical protein